MMTRLGISRARLAFILGGLAMFGPFSIDTVFTAFPPMEQDLGVDPVLGEGELVLGDPGRLPEPVDLGTDRRRAVDPCGQRDRHRGRGRGEVEVGRTGRNH